MSNSIEYIFMSLSSILSDHLDPFKIHNFQNFPSSLHCSFHYHLAQNINNEKSYSIFLSFGFSCLRFPIYKTPVTVKTRSLNHIVLNNCKVWTFEWRPLSCFHVSLYVVSERGQVHFLHIDVSEPQTCSLLNSFPISMVLLKFSWVYTCMFISVPRLYHLTCLIFDVSDSIWKRR